jgi:hypothetical protein
MPFVPTSHVRNLRAALRVASALAALLVVVLVPRPVAAQRPGNVAGPTPGARSPVRPLTRAELSQYRETSRYGEVMDFVREVVRGRRRMHLTSFGYSFEGRELPVVVVGDLRDGSPEAVRASGKLRVFIQANIHSGESDGKEAALMLLRDLAQGGHARWLDSLVLLVAPVFNVDGTERVSLTSRPLQHGPIGGAGQRANAQGLDLNRDHTKLETPEVRSQVRLLNAWDPHVAMDLHTTDGSVHGYLLTYAEPLHPATDPGLTALVRGEWLPAVTSAIRARHGWESWFYGNFADSPVDRGGGGQEPGWYTFDHRPRFSENYWGLRNRAGILVESYAYATFEERVRAMREFLEATLDWAWAHASRIRDATEAADGRSATLDSVPVRARLHRGLEVEILQGEVAEERHPYTGQRMLRRLDVRRPVRRVDFTTFEGAEYARVPRAYFVPPALSAVIERLSAHGIRLERLERPLAVSGERFRIDSTWTAERAFQNHRERTVTGAWEAAPLELPAGTVVVRMDQPLARLAVILLEPRSDDGFLAWNLFDEALQREPRVYPVVRAFAGF